jgi:UDP-N-acetylmuramyl pentapeptide phosphotransferase/UDP-N-acetylglucosamine-1-phosphate transferase
MSDVLDSWQIAYIVIAAAGVSYGLNFLLMPLLRRYAQARPSARSSHKIPTPQGGGAAVVAAVILVVAGATAVLPSLNLDGYLLAAILAAGAFLAIIGATDDMRPLEALPRLLLQAAAVAVVIATLPDDLWIFHALPFWLERALMLVAILWLVNLVNFMDGIDWMTVAEVVPVASGLAVFGLLGALPVAATLVAIALCGAILGFAPFNRPVARLFLGDVGSLPIGLLLGWLLILLAGRGHLVAALLLPLYYLSDATITLLRRLAHREPVLLAHRNHFYQRALDNGMSAYAIVGRVFAVNTALAALAMATLLSQILWAQVAALIAGCIFVGWLLYSFESQKK